jgi:hypothetical protein
VRCAEREACPRPDLAFVSGRIRTLVEKGFVQKWMQDYQHHFVKEKRKRRAKGKDPLEGAGGKGRCRCDGGGKCRGKESRSHGSMAMDVEKAQGVFWLLALGVGVGSFLVLAEKSSRSYPMLLRALGLLGKRADEAGAVEGPSGAREARGIHRFRAVYGVRGARGSGAGRADAAGRDRVPRVAGASATGQATDGEREVVKKKEPSVLRSFVLQLGYEMGLSASPPLAEGDQRGDERGQGGDCEEHEQLEQPDKRREPRHQAQHQQLKRRKTAMA